MFFSTRNTALKFIGVIICIVLYNCANQTTPSGGPKDETPPKLISSSPNHKQKNFKGREIALLFDEYIALNNAKDEILISPSPGKDISYTAKKNKVIIEPENGWEDSTTYSISFREGIRDITENNPPENLKLAFSTGPTIDSLEIRGRVKFLLSETLPEKITIAIYKSDTFDIFEHTPNYFTISTKKATFSIENIKQGTYYLYAFADNNKNLKVESRTESFGFIASPIEVKPKQDSITIPLIKLDTRPLKVNSIRNNGLTTLIKFNKAVTTYSLTYDKPELVIHSYGSDPSEIALYNPDEILDSLQFRIVGKDSLANQADSTFYIKTVENRSLPDLFKITSTTPSFDLDKNVYELQLSLSKPLYKFTADSMYIELDTLNRLSVLPDNFTYDTLQKKLQVRIPVIIDSLFAHERKPQLIFAPSSFISFELDSSKAIKHPLVRLKPQDTGILLVEIQTTSPHFIIQLLNSQDEIVQTSRNEKNISFKNLKAQSYKLRAIIDDNNNGVWDVGNIYLRKEPEQTYYYTTSDNKYTFPIRANWELGPLLLKF
ncbi:MAG: Ig-like domain-containing protein [Cyclobacteriaceae bacterium]